MSDPVTNVEIEDVLSSIRRLVSSDDRDGDADHDSTPAAEFPPEARAQADSKLVLTPAQRVDDAPAEAEAEAETASVAGEVEIETPDTASTDGWLDHVEDAELIEAVEEADVQEESQQVEIPSFIRRRAEDGAAQPSEASDERETSADAAAEAKGDVAQDDVDAAVQADLKALEQRIAGFENAVAEQEDDWEPDGGSEDDYAAGPVSPLPWDEGEEADEDLSADTASEDNADAAPPEAVPDDTAQDDDAIDVAMQSVAEPGPDPEMDTPAQTADTDRDGDSVDWYADDAVLDEEALRDMVSEIVRQELQGALGERITRNVRKLVRREIHRALMSQGID